MQKIVFYMMCMTLFVCHIHHAHAEPVSQNQTPAAYVEVFDTTKEEVISQTQWSPSIHAEVQLILKHLTICDQFALKFDGILAKIPVIPAVSVDSNITREKIMEIILYRSNNWNERNLLLLITQSGKTVICYSEHSFDPLIDQLIISGMIE
ncbi:hypothetical protein NV379_07980 [Paenibacillus sp. N1-5-1-14]|uniref:hypothetical protein n=1 Tax=Paenibacillus radicibacter TaxID=2972488 RepID=UPI002159A9D1|nr:hypothetical protein [Paenibacillus radicibacter]MCR8642600.1 hypothetical protein [Paenibacillus radicibacter]